MTESNTENRRGLLEVAADREAASGSKQDVDVPEGTDNGSADTEGENGVTGGEVDSQVVEVTVKVSRQMMRRSLQGRIRE